MTALLISTVRQRLPELVQQVNDDHDPIIVVTKTGKTRSSSPNPTGTLCWRSSMPYPDPASDGTTDAERSDRRPQTGISVRRFSVPLKSSGLRV